MIVCALDFGKLLLKTTASASGVAAAATAMLVIHVQMKSPCWRLGADRDTRSKF